MKSAAPPVSLLCLAALCLPGCTATEDVKPASVPPDSPAARARVFLAAYTETFRHLYYASSLAEWISNTKIVEGDDSNLERTKAANDAKAKFSGSVENIETARELLEFRDELDPIQVLELEAVLYNAAQNPQTVPELVSRRIEAEARQSELLYGFRYTLDGAELTTNQIDAALREESDLARRRAVWEASKEVGPTLRAGLEELRDLRNDTVRALGYPDYFSYQTSQYGWDAAELIERVDRINRELRPLFRELHTWARHELARRYGEPVPDLIPAHWLSNRWGQDWSGLIEVEGLDLEAQLEPKGAEWLVRQAERFYVSLGFEPLPAVFWESSSLYPLPEDAGYKKNNHASAWHLDLERDVRSLMSVEPDAEWYETTHHELGHIYYYLSYTNPRVPPLLREGANRAYHEAVGSLMGLAAMQPGFLNAIGLGGGERPDPTMLLLKEALNYVVFIPWSTGVMSHFEKELYADELASSRWNARWWELAAKFQGIAPPQPRGEQWCDAATKTHVNDDPAQYYDYALSFVLLFQLHDHIAREILHQDPRDTNYYGQRAVGDFLRSILEPGATVDGDELLRRVTGSDLSAKAMLAYFEPLMGWLGEQNAGREATLPEL